MSVGDVCTNKQLSKQITYLSPDLKMKEMIFESLHRCLQSQLKDKLSMSGSPGGTFHFISFITMFVETKRSEKSNFWCPTNKKNFTKILTENM